MSCSRFHDGSLSSAYRKRVRTRERSSWDDSSCGSKCGWTAWLSWHTCPGWRAGGSYFYPPAQHPHINSCPHGSCQSGVRNSRPISSLPLSRAPLWHFSAPCLSSRLLRPPPFWFVFDLTGDVRGLVGLRDWGFTSPTGRTGIDYSFFFFFFLQIWIFFSGTFLTRLFSRVHSRGH